MIGSFLWGRLKAKNKKKESSEDAEGTVESDHQGAHNPAALNSISPNQNLTPTSSLSPWSAASRQMDMGNSHADIDLMRGWHVLCIYFRLMITHLILFSSDETMKSTNIRIEQADFCNS